MSRVPTPRWPILLLRYPNPPSRKTCPLEMGLLDFSFCEFNKIMTNPSLTTKISVQFVKGKKAPVKATRYRDCYQSVIPSTIIHRYGLPLECRRWRHNGTVYDAFVAEISYLCEKFIHYEESISSCGLRHDGRVFSQ